MKDDYTINIIKPKNFDSLKTYHLVFVADGSIGMGEYLSGSNPSWKADIPSNCIVVTIGHVGDYKKKRRRDFIPSDRGGYKDEHFGNAALFYDFLKNDIVPLIEKEFPISSSKVFIGHSFSGLFSLYASLKNDGLFDQYFAISPSVWANHNELLKIEKQFAATNTNLQANIHIIVGGLEVFNRVLSSSKNFYTAIKNRNYPGLHISYEIINGANHYSIRKPAIDKILASLSR